MGTFAGNQVATRPYKNGFIFKQELPHICSQVIGFNRVIGPLFPLIASYYDLGDMGTSAGSQVAPPPYKRGFILRQELPHICKQAI